MLPAVWIKVLRQAVTAELPGTRKICGPGIRSHRDIAFHSSAPATIYAASDVGSYTGVGGVYKSTDSGETWDLVHEGITAAKVRSVSVAPSNSAIMVAGTKEGVIYRSLDAGRTWTSDYNRISFSQILAIQVDPEDPNRVYAVSNDLFVSLDKGVTFTKTGPMENAYCIALSPSSSMRFVGCTSGDGIYRSSNGTDWSTVSQHRTAFIC